MAVDFTFTMIPFDKEGILELAQRLYLSRNEVFRVKLADGPIELTGRRLVLNAFLWRPLIKRGYPIEKRHSILDGLATKARLASVHTEIYNDAIDDIRKSKHDIEGQLESQILYDIMENYDHLHHWVANCLGEYHLSLSAFELCELMEDPRVKPLTEINLDAEMKVSITAAENKLKQQGNELMKVLEDETIPNNVVAPFLKLGLLSRVQFPQVMMALGFRDDASHRIVRYPITASFANGLQNIVDFAVESLSAKKTIYYNKNAMPESQYDNRKQQILASSIRKLYRGDCGSKITVPYYLHQNNVKHAIGKNIITSDGVMVQLNKRNIDTFSGKLVQLRSPLTCRYTDGTCRVCGGRLTDFMHHDIVIGVASTTEYMSDASQLVLSAKHFSQTDAIAYVVPELLNDLLMVRQNDVFIKPGVDVSKLKVKVQYWDVQHINELKHKPGEDNSEFVMGEQQFSSINYLTFLDQDDVPITGEISMESNEVVPYFSTEIINHIRSNFKTITIGDEVVIPLKKFDHVREPLLRCIVESNSMIKFNKTLERFVDKDIRNFTSIPEALEAFTNIVYQKIGTNLLHLEIVLKSYLITSDEDYKIPIVEDVNRVKFDCLKNVIPRRSLGQEFSYQELLRYISDANSYIYPHPPSLFDTFFYDK